MKSFNHISANDQVLATLEANGRVLASINKCNFKNVDDVIRFVSAMAGQFWGLAKLTIRNRTQGWSLNVAVAGKRVPSLALGGDSATPAFMPHDGLQYRIPW